MGPHHRYWGIFAWFSQKLDWVPDHEFFHRYPLLSPYWPCVAPHFSTLETWGWHCCKTYFAMLLLGGEVQCCDLSTCTLGFTSCQQFSSFFAVSCRQTMLVYIYISSCMYYRCWTVEFGTFCPRVTLRGFIFNWVWLFSVPYDWTSAHWFPRSVVISLKYAALTAHIQVYLAYSCVRFCVHWISAGIIYLRHTYVYIRNQDVFTAPINDCSCSYNILASGSNNIWYGDLKMKEAWKEAAIIMPVLIQFIQFCVHVCSNRIIPNMQLSYFYVWCMFLILSFYIIYV